MLRPVTTEKAVRLIELNNTLVFEVDRRTKKPQIKKDIEEGFKVKVESINSMIRGNKKFIYAKLNPKDLAVDVATSLGMI